MSSLTIEIAASESFNTHAALHISIYNSPQLGIPMSTTHASVGAVMGTGMADRGFWTGLNWKLLMKIFASWALTLPIVALFTGGIFSFLFPICVTTPIMTEYPSP
jgi:phosphate/sulfate permease